MHQIKQAKEAHVHIIYGGLAFHLQLNHLDSKNLLHFHLGSPYSIVGQDIHLMQNLQDINFQA
jgi:hypothetical protein